ncbi:MAG: hypothetical protein KatS3mg128_0402 [Silanimonas sp.]|nr:MAG: hypothetical protein KatS3mg128_0402 [Silanimonas sp.]
MRMLGLGATTLVLFSGCASVPTPVSLQAGTGQELSYSQGMGCVQGGADTSDGFILTSLCAQPKDRSRSVLIVRVSNRTSRPVTIHEDAVSARSGTSPLEVLAYTALMKEEKTRQTWAAISAGLAAASNSMAASTAGYSSYQGTAYTSATAYGSGGHARANATTTYSGTTYNAAAAAAARQRANAENARLFERLEAEKQMGEQAIEGALRAHTLQPGESHAAFVEMELPRRRNGEAQPVEVVLRLEGTETRFVMNVGP